MDTNYSKTSEEIFLAKADQMAAAAVSFNCGGCGYDMFIQARDELKQAIHYLFQNTKLQP